MSRFALKRLALALAFLPLADSAAALGPDVTPLVSSAWLVENLDADDLVILDIRSSFEFQEAHIPGALQTDYPGRWTIERDGVVSMLPEIAVLEAYLTELGIDNETTVVIVPGGVGINDLSSATWIYWVFKYLGHDRVAIHHGGWDDWYFDGGFPEEAGVTVPTPAGQFVASLRPEILADTDYVADRLGGDTILIDARPERQYSGAAILPGVVDRPGHIPGAINIPNDVFYDYTEVRFAELETIADRVPPRLADRTAPMIVYCSVGQASSMSWFVFHELLGYEDVRLYEASMAAWSLRGDLPLVTGTE
jgi:thiosulfate/3-mercaptopyruvate sulfurtransferase